MKPWWLDSLMELNLDILLLVKISSKLLQGPFKVAIKF